MVINLSFCIYPASSHHSLNPAQTKVLPNSKIPNVLAQGSKPPVLFLGHSVLFQFLPHLQDLAQVYSRQS